MPNNLKAIVECQLPTSTKEGRGLDIRWVPLLPHLFSDEDGAGSETGARENSQSRRTGTHGFFPMFVPQVLGSLSVRSPVVLSVLSLLSCWWRVANDFACVQQYLDATTQLSLSVNQNMQQ